MKRRHSRTYYVYIVSNYRRTTFYIGVTNNIYRRMLEHRQGKVRGFSQKYRLKFLVYVEVAEYIQDALAREKQLKNWHREWKVNLIRSVNPDLKDLFDE